MGKHRLTKHHRRPRAKSGDNSNENISIVPRGKHNSWHSLFGIMDPPEIADLINSVWLDPRYEFICIKKNTIDSEEKVAMIKKLTQEDSCSYNDENQTEINF